MERSPDLIPDPDLTGYPYSRQVDDWSKSRNISLKVVCNSFVI